MANVSFTDRLPRHREERLNARELEFQTEVDCGFNIPSAYKSHNGQLNQLLAIATLIASFCVASTVSAQMFWG